LSYSIDYRILVETLSGIPLWSADEFIYCDADVMQYTWLLTLFIPLLLIAVLPANERPSHHTDAGFRNPWFTDDDDRSFTDFLKWQWDRRVRKNIVKPDRYNFEIIPSEYVNLPQSVYGGMLTWVGHSTFLIQIAGINILTDPVWSDRVGPLRFLGPKRYTPPGIPWSKLPQIHAVLISHNHYDHMDRSTIERLNKEYAPTFFVPLGNKKMLDEWGIQNTIEMDWYDVENIDEIAFICTPSQHFSQRWLNDHNEMLWSSWIIKAPNATIFFAGDTGYFPEFTSIGERYGPIDLALLPIGAYKPRWFMRPVHVDPTEALQAFLDLDARYMAAMHWGTFDQADELLDEPPRELLQAVDSLHVDKDRVWIFAFGETRSIPPREDQ
jgi:N-acyl-phosphatidylethanolamine-hydrolysing phospholipase D